MQRHDRRRDDAPPPWRGGAARQSHSSPISCLHSRISKPASRHAPFDGAHATSTPSPLHVWISWATPTRQLSLRILGLSHPISSSAPAAPASIEDLSERSKRAQRRAPRLSSFQSALSKPTSSFRFCLFAHLTSTLLRCAIPSSPSLSSFVVYPSHNSVFLPFCRVIRRRTSRRIVLTRSRLLYLCI